MTSIQYIILHHSGIHSNKMGEKEHYKAIENKLHQEYGSRFVLQYHHVIGHQGTHFKGQPEGLVCPHVGFDRFENDINNWNSLGVCCMGNFEKEFMKPVQFQSLVKVLRQLKIKHGIPNFRIHPHNSIIPTLCPGEHYPYNDIMNSVLEKPWYDEAVEFCMKKGIMTGDEDGFRPDDPVIRAELASVLYRMYHLEDNKEIV
ncbi:MAG TPA: N-acetylmuramoyl-L-alanine amidase [Caldisericia bacterium]|jgi:N-acetyl-anhydromuramyl-L-alanine amidase AmpD|nr:N-acetylmuramoyl-L-alanine amidase [Caldisericia bacterium]